MILKLRTLRNLAAKSEARINVKKIASSNNNRWEQPILNTVRTLREDDYTAFTRLLKNASVVEKELAKLKKEIADRFQTSMMAHHFTIADFQESRKAFATTNRREEWIKNVCKAIYLAIDNDLDETSNQDRLRLMLNELNDLKVENNLCEQGNLFHFAAHRENLVLFEFLFDYYKSYDNSNERLKTKLNQEIANYGTPLNMLATSLWEGETAEYREKCLKLIKKYISKGYADLNISNYNDDKLQELVEHYEEMNAPITEMVASLIREREGSSY